MVGTRINLPVALNVKEFGAVGDGVTDDAAAIQRALDAAGTGALGRRRYRVEFPPGQYRLLTGLTSSTGGIELFGTGGTGQDGTLGFGATEILVDAGIVGFTFNPSASSTQFKGPAIRNLHFRAGSGTPTGGVLIKRSNNWILENVVASGFSGASSYGLKSDGTGNVNQYGTITNGGANNCKIGLDIVLTNGLRVIGGMYDGNSNSGSVAAGTTGIRFQSGDSLKMTNVVIQFYATGLDIQGTGGLFCSVMGCRFEGMTTHVVLAGDYNSFSGNTHSNFIIGSTGTGYSIAATADRNWIVGNHMVSLGTHIANSGTNTVYTDFSGTYPVLSIPDAGSLRWASGNVVTSGNGSPEGSVTAPVGSLFLRLNGGANTTLYIKESGAGSSGWAAK